MSDFPEKSREEKLIPSEVLAPRTLPQAGQRLAEALRTLLKNKDFNSITTAEIARTAQANEALIYRYFDDKRGLLHHVLAEYLKKILQQITEDLEGAGGFSEKLRQLVWRTVEFYLRELVFAKILLIEVRNFPAYFDSDTYQIVRYYSRLLTVIVDEGKENGEVRLDIPTAAIRDIVLGSMEHLFMPKIILGLEVDADTITDQICLVVEKGVLTD